MFTKEMLHKAENTVRLIRSQITQRFSRRSKYRILSISAAVILTAALIFGLCYTIATAAVRENTVRTKRITSIYIKKGDTLWSIAKDFQTKEYPSLPDYIQEIKECNRLFNEDIQTGEYLVVPYYTDKADLR